MADKVHRTFEIVNEKGLHARASAKLVELVERFDADAEVSRDGLSASGDSIMGLLMLAASRGGTITSAVRVLASKALEYMAKSGAASASTG